MSERKTKLKPPRRSSQVSDSSTSSESTSSFSSEDEETDARDLKPIKDYLNDRRELASQLFKSVKLEKIRMMLPQALKKMNLYDLEEWCGSELIGMSRKRILSIINGQRMAESSDTDESDDSGPSLEIISDTEEWLTDDEVKIKEENSSCVKSKLKKNTDKVRSKSRALPKDKVKLISKPIINPGKENKSSDARVKVEGEKAEPKEGESLLDLLELEMRARAIRALIRKEGDIPDKTAAGTSSTKNTPNVAGNAGNKYIVQEMEQISVSLKQGSGLDDDVMLVIQPAPTIELLSSESENEKEDKDMKEESKRVNQRLENERETRKEGKSKQVDPGLESGSEKEKEEQSKRVNKRLENERGTETTHSTSTIGDEVVEVQDNDDLKIKGQSPFDNEGTETDTVIEEPEKSQISPEEVVHVVTAEAQDKEADSKSEGIDRTDEIISGVSDKSTGNTSDAITYNPADDRGDERVKVEGEEPEKESEEAPNATNGSESIAAEPQKAIDAETAEKSPEKPNSPVKELEEGELTSDSDSKEESEVLESNIKEHLFNKRVRRGRHMRSKVHDSSEGSQDLDQRDTAELERRLSKLRKKIRNTDAKRIGSKEPVHDDIKKNDDVEDPSAKEADTQNEIGGQKEEQKKQDESRKQHEDVDKACMEEIIDLDDYPDDMDELENSEQNKTDVKKKSTEAPESSSGPTEPTETWASRYYNTDDVQNVIKESKIQSEIRKRLRERQRIGKLNNSPNTTTGSNSPVDIKAEEAKQKPLGSVEEYLALKAATAALEDPSVNEEIEDLPERSGKSRRRRDSSHKSKSHSSKRRTKSDKKSAKDNGTSARKKEVTIETSAESRPD